MERYLRQVGCVIIPANPVVHSFGFDRVCDLLTEFCQRYPTLPLVSIGCGLATLEREARGRVKNDFFLVDPQPGSYYPQCKNDLHRLIVQAGMPMTHSYTKELLETNPEIARGGGCLLFLNWCDYGLNDYDLEAVRLLKPYAVLTSVDTTGSAGSKQFHQFLKDTTEYRKKRTYSLKQAKKEKHACSHETIAIYWLERRRGRAVPCENGDVQTIFKCLQVHDDTNQQNILTLHAREQEAKQKAASIDKITSVIREIKLKLAIDDDVV